MKKLAFITGATSGIGLGIAKKFASMGINIAFNGRAQNMKEIEDIQRLYRNEYKIDSFYHDADVSKMEEINLFHQNIVKHYNQSVDILVNCAGIQYVCPVHQFPPEKFEEIISVNLLSVFYTTRLVIPSMIQNNWGRIINISSCHGKIASPFKSAYIASKHGIEGFTKSVALEVAERGVTVNTICPGYVDTPLVRNQIADTARVRNIKPEDVIKNVILANQPTRKLIDIEDIAGLAAFLIGDSAKNITGTAMIIDGGFTAQ